MVARTNPRYYKSQWLLSGSWLQSEERRAIRQFQQRLWRNLTSDRFKRVAEQVIFWSLVTFCIVMFYTFASAECAMGRDCTFASSHWANWLFGKK